MTVHDGADLAEHSATSDVPTLVAHVFRRWHSRLITALVRVVGAHQLELAEDAAQDAMLAALQHWPFRGVPAQPDAWLYQVARRKLLDRLARARTAQHHASALEAEWSVDVPEFPLGDDVMDAQLAHDDELTMLFLCAHPLLNVDAQVTLMLRTVCGLTASEIAVALLVPESTIAQRLVRAKRTLGQQREPFVLPAADKLPGRLDVVLRALYLMFTEGHSATRGDSPVRRELCNEAIRLSAAVASIPYCASPKVFALCSLLELQSSRLDARERTDGTTIPLDAQNRDLWKRDAIARGMLWLARAATGDAVSDYHLQAAIAAEHAMTVDGAPTNWLRIRLHYEQLLQHNASPIVRLNHAFAVARTDGAAAAVALLHALQDDPRLKSNHLLPAMQAVLHTELRQTEAAAACTRLALQRVRTLADRALLLERAQALEGVSLLGGVLK